MLDIYNKRTVIEFPLHMYKTLCNQVKSRDGFKFRLRNPICYPHVDYVADSFVFSSKHKREGLRTLMVNAESIDGDEYHACVFTFHFRGSGATGPYFQLLATNVNWNNDTVVFGSSQGFYDFVRDHPDTPVTCRFGMRKYKAAFQHSLPLPAHNPSCVYACRLWFSSENRTLDVFFYQK